MFSSDPPVFTTSVEDYNQPSQKRQHLGPWYEMEEAKELRKPKNKTGEGLSRAHCRPFRRFDSGVYMESDESEESEPFSDRSPASDPPATAKCRVGDPMEDTRLQNLELEDDEAPQPVVLEPFSEDQLFEKAMQTAQDPGDFEGPVFPYWQDQPGDLRYFHVNQRLAHERVMQCVELGEEVLDLS